MPVRAPTRTKQFFRARAPEIRGFWFKAPVPSPVQNLGPLGSTVPLQAPKRHWRAASLNFLCRGGFSPPTFERKVLASRDWSALTNLTALNTLVVEPSLYDLPFQRYSQNTSFPVLAPPLNVPQPRA